MSEQNPKSSILTVLLWVIVIILAIIAAPIIINMTCDLRNSRTPDPLQNFVKDTEVNTKRVICGMGYVRGQSMWNLINKYAGYVSKVNFVSHKAVKAGDVILQYDDFDIREEITKKEDEILKQQEDVALKLLQLKLKQLDPLPSDYRNMHWRLNAAQALFKRLEHEENIYKHLHSLHTISDLEMRGKQQEMDAAKAELNVLEENADLLKNGLSELYTNISAQDLKIAEMTLKKLEHELTLLKEKRKYYSIVAPHDGITVTNSDTVTGYDNAGCVAASIHFGPKLVYAYFTEEDMKHIKWKMKGTFYSVQHAETVAYPVTVYDTGIARNSQGNQIYYVVQFTVDKEVEPLMLEEAGRVEIILK